MTNEPSAEVIAKLQAATAARQSAGAAQQPVAAPPLKEPTTAGSSAGIPGTAGNGTAKYLLIDHYFGGAVGTFWGFDGTSWRAANEAQPADEQGIAQVAFAANRVDLYWNANDALTLVRCWKNL